MGGAEPDRRVLLPGTSRIPVAVAPDLRARSYRIEVELVGAIGDDQGVLLACGDAQAGYSLHVDGLGLHHTYRHAGLCSVVSGRPSPGAEVLAVTVDRTPDAAVVALHAAGRRIGAGHIGVLAATRISYSGLDIGTDRGVGVGTYAAPFPFTGRIRRAVVTSWSPGPVDRAGALAIELGTG